LNAQFFLVISRAAAGRMPHSRPDDVAAIAPACALASL
jgi:hypothetical protein